jgi:hypothetical protein
LWSQVHQFRTHAANPPRILRRVFTGFADEISSFLTMAFGEELLCRLFHA